MLEAKMAFAEKATVPGQEPPHHLTVIAPEPWRTCRASAAFMKKHSPLLSRTGVLHRFRDSLTNRYRPSHIGSWRRPCSTSPDRPLWPSPDRRIARSSPRWQSSIRSRAGRHRRPAQPSPESSSKLIGMIVNPCAALIALLEVCGRQKRDSCWASPDRARGAVIRMIREPGVLSLASSTPRRRHAHTPTVRFSVAML